MNIDQAFLQKQRQRLENRKDRYELVVIGSNTLPDFYQRQKINAMQYVDAALAKISNGTYGICEDCHNPIPRVRLEAVPGAIRCVPCQEKLEVTHLDKSDDNPLSIREMAKLKKGQRQAIALMKNGKDKKEIIKLWANIVHDILLGRNSCCNSDACFLKLDQEEQLKLCEDTPLSFSCFFPI